jgi:ATP-dependent 26S proteasome regulatory subunit
LNKTGKESKKKETTLLSNYTPSKDVYQEIRDIQNEAKKKYERNSNRIKSMSTYSSSIGNLPGSVFTTSGYINSPTITSTSLGSSAITIDGSINGSMRVDVPLIVSGRDVMKELDEMRDVLLLLRRDVDMEAKYPRLKELKDEYEAALAKYKTFDTLKESK